LKLSRSHYHSSRQYGGIEIDYSKIVLKIQSGHNIDDFDQSLMFKIADAAVVNESKFVAKEARLRLTSAECILLDVSQNLVENKLENCLILLDSCLDLVRRPGTRNRLIEAKARMKRGQVRQMMGDPDSISDLNWAMERLNAVEPGGDDHGFAILCVAAFHEERNEPMMALAILSEISTTGNFNEIIVALSRRGAARAYSLIGDYSASIRHYWTAWKIFCIEGNDALSQSCALHCLDLMLSSVSDGAARIDNIIAEASPQPRSVEQPHPTNPLDISSLLNWLESAIIVDLSGEIRPDLVLWIEGNIVVKADFRSDFLVRIDSVQDNTALDLLKNIQS